MPFKNRLLTILKIFRSNGTLALVAKGGPNASTAGYGDAVLQFFTGKTSETHPGEIVANNAGGAALYELDLLSPSGSNTVPADVRYIASLIGSDTGARAQMIGDITAFMARSGQPSNSHVVALGTIKPMDATAILLSGNLDVSNGNIIGDDSGVLTNRITAAAGFSISTQVMRIKNRSIFVYVNIQRTGAAIAAVADGNIANVTFATLNNASDFPFNLVGGANTASGFMVGTAIQTDGQMILTMLPPNIGLATGASFAVSFYYPLG